MNLLFLEVKLIRYKFISDQISQEKFYNSKIGNLLANANYTESVSIISFLVRKSFAVSVLVLFERFFFSLIGLKTKKISHKGSL